MDKLDPLSHSKIGQERLFVQSDLSMALLHSCRLFYLRGSSVDA